MKKKVLVGIILIALLVIGGFGISLCFPNKELTIDEILETKAYSYLSPRVKEYIKEYYEETGKVLLTKELAKNGETYLNPSYIDYLDSDKQDEYGVIPSVTAYTPKLVSSGETFPAKFDLRSVDGKNFVTPNKNQGDEGLCWAYATTSLLETHDLITKNKSYDSSAIRLSEKQIDYALSSNGIIGGNTITKRSRTLSYGGYLTDSEELLSRRLGGVQDTWNTTNSSAISNNSPLAPSIVFDRTKVLYEADDSVFLNNINATNDEELNMAMREEIKRLAYHNGGVTVSIATSGTHVSGMSKINYNGNTGDYIAVDNQYANDIGTEMHALHLIGWDDDYEYSYCSNTNSYFGVTYPVWNYNGTCNNGTLIEGRGAWILKNSWGSNYRILYLTYDSKIYDLMAITSYAEERNWDNNYSLSPDGIEFSIDDKFFNLEKLVKIKIFSLSSGEASLYYSENGESNNYALIGNYTFDLGGYKTIDLSDRNIIVSKNSKFKMSLASKIELFTNNIDSAALANTSDFVYSLDTEIPSNDEYLNITPTTAVRSISDNSLVNYKIKNSSDEYLSNDSYIVSSNKEYCNYVKPNIRLASAYAKKGNFSLETWYDDDLIDTSQITIDVDYISTKGSGTSDNPWQIENVRQFNMMRNANMDYYKLMNDLDFEYDTNNPDGLFYNSGHGWNYIEEFGGNLDGNNKTIRNIKAKDGLINKFETNSLVEEAGIHDLIVDNIVITPRDNSGGIVNELNIKGYKYNFNNLKVFNVLFEMDVNQAGLDPNAGGIIGNLKLSTAAISPVTVLKIDNWYAQISVTCDDEFIYSYESNAGVAGIIGAINMRDSVLSLNNIKTNITYNFQNSKTIYRVSDIIGYMSVSSDSTIRINNVVGIVNSNSVSNGETNLKAVANFLSVANGAVANMNGIKSTLNYTPNARVNVSNSNFGLKPYEIARADYDSSEYYEDQYYVYDQYYNKTTKVSFRDKFNVSGNEIPTLKKFPESYSEYYKTYTIGVGEEKNIMNLISNDTNYRNLHVYKSFECDLDVCGNVTDETIVTAPTAANGYNFTGLKSGITSLIIYDELSGYLDKVRINVLASDEYILSLDYNYDDIIDSNHIIKTNATYGSLPILERDGYNFLGWYTDKTEGTKIENDSTFTGDSNITLYAHWEINKYNITFDSAGGSEVNSQEVDYNGKVTRPANPTKEGYTFKEWQLNGNLYDFDTLVTDSITLTAVYTLNEYTVTFNSDGGTSVTSQKVNHNEKVTRPTNPTKEGYTFKEWQLNGNLYDFDTLVTDNITLTAVYTINQYTVTFDSNGGTSITEQTVDYNGKTTEPTNPTKEGYTFKGWKLNGNTYDFNTLVTGNITLLAEWEINHYTITFNSDGGTSVTSQTIDYNGKATRPTDPTRGGYQFKGWQLDGSLYDFDTPITGNITLTAVWEVLSGVLSETLQNNSYTVTNNLVTGFTVGKTVQEIKNELGNDIVIETNNSVISTGAVIKKNNESFTVVVKGDLTGDGRINSGDLLQMRKHLLEDVILTGAYKEAGIIESNGNIKSLDLLRLRQYLLGDYTFR